ncbi:cation:proton antiporter [Salinarchaeum sp. IM2453]|uniref:cation:proton antiporter domain-containing protein n=1 Tax=Salinarchaeum sp. IM2453 TaxID=2862870 RepID=UPI001C83FD80|nr:cation:proton antiporter [Salinarchaeum sp. IM2453]QZA88177.1 cation:proton antiporter [Salinarchaeum sp. IM2453]
MTEVIITLSVVFVAAGALLLLANQFSYPIIPFYIIAGVIAGVVISPDDIIDLAQWGIAFLVFVFGIRIDLSDIQLVFRDVEIPAVTQLLVVSVIAASIGYGLSLSFGFEHPSRNAIYFAAAAILSSTIVGSGILANEIQNNLVYGRLSSSIHFFDDIIAIGLVLILSAETLTDPQLIASNIGVGVLLLLAGIVFYRYGFPILVRIAGGSDELVLMGSISILIAFIAAAEITNVSIVVGAFAAGLAIRDTGEEALTVRNGINSIKDFFAAVFFVTIGALVQLPTIETLVLTAVLITLVLFVNPAIYTVAFLYEGYDIRTSFFASSALTQTSEFALIIAIQAWMLGTIAQDLFNAIILAAAITMIATALIRRYEETLYSIISTYIINEHRTRQVDEHSSVDKTLEDHTVIIGYSQKARQLVRRLEALNEPYVVVENDPVQRKALESDCQNYVFGDAMASYPMEKARVSQANLVVSTVDYDPLSRSLIEYAAETDIIVQADNPVNAQELLDMGATFVALPDRLASNQLIENIQRVCEDNQEISRLKEEHLRYLSGLSDEPVSR